MSVDPVPPSHPVLVAITAARAAVVSTRHLPVTFLTGSEKRTALLELTATLGQLEELRLRVLAAGQALGDVTEADGARDAAAWLAHHGRVDAGRARWLGRLAIALDERYPALRSALAEGRVDLAQADVIARALDELPDDLEVETLRMAEERLVMEAETFDPRRLRILGRRILEVVAPDVADEHARRALDDEEAHADAVTFLRVRRRGDGTTDIHARLADAVAARLMTNLHAYTSPRQPAQRPPHEPAPVDRRPYERKLGHALGSLLEHLDPHRLPLHGGDATTVVVTVPLDDLQDGLGAAGLARVGDEPLTPSQARRLACTAKIIPAVLGRKSEALDLGRSSRLFSPAQRKALALKHPTCVAAGCTIPAPWCEAHHAGQPWSRGGRTNLTDGVLLCSHHHHRAHDPRYHTQHERDGAVSFHRRE
jgi:hypothetical protein